MNLFLLGWNITDHLAGAALRALRGMHRKYPQLDPTTLSSRKYGAAFAAFIHTSDCAAAPREYAFSTAGGVTLWDGVCVARTGGFAAHRAEELERHWDSLTETLEGQYFAARATCNPSRLELITDPLGMLHTYYINTGKFWLISNDAGLIEVIAGARAWDPVGISTFITLGWAGADRTLRQEVLVVPAAQHWIWSGSSNEPRKHTYYSITDLALLPTQDPQTRDAELVSSLIDLSRQLSSSYGPLTAMLTGGRDSRLIAAVLIAGRIDFSFTTGVFLKEGAPWDEETSREVEIAGEVARTLQRKHRVNAREAEDLPDWDTAARRWVRQYDGLRSLCDLSDMPVPESPIQYLPLYVGGVGGEIARGFYTTDDLLIPGLSVARAASLLLQRCFRRPENLFTRKTRELLQQYFDGFVSKMIETGLPLSELADAFYVHERGRRFTGSAQQINRATMDRFQPLCTRPWLKAVFAVPAALRCDDFHEGLIVALAPQLQDVPFDKPSKRRVKSASPAHPREAASAATGGTPRSAAETKRVIDRRASMLKSNLTSVREVCLDQTDSPLWEFIDRQSFEQITDQEQCEKSGWPYWRTSVIFDIATSFYYSIV